MVLRANEPWRKLLAIRPGGGELVADFVVGALGLAAHGGVEVEVVVELAERVVYGPRHGGPPLWWKR
jgi:hypothetical protein